MLNVHRGICIQSDIHNYFYRYIELLLTYNIYHVKMWGRGDMLHIKIGHSQPSLLVSKFEVIEKFQYFASIPTPRVRKS